MNPISQAALGKEIPSSHARTPTPSELINELKRIAGQGVGGQILHNPLRKLGFLILLAYIFLMFGRLTDFYLAGMRIPFIIAALAIVTTLASGMLGRVLNQKVTRYFLGYTVCLVLASVLGIWRSNSFAILGEVWGRTILLFLATAALVVTYKESVKAIQMMGIAGWCLCVLSFFHGHLEDGRLELSNGYYTNPNDLAHGMLTAIFLSWCIAANPKVSWPIKLLAYGMMPPLLLIMFRTGSRGALLALVIGFPLIFRYYGAAARIGVVVMCLIGVATMPLVISKEVISRMMVFFDTDVGDDDPGELKVMAVGSTYGRLEVLMSAVKVAVTHPLLGVGPGNFATADAIEHDKKQTGTRAHWSVTHNTYAEIASEVGFPALFCYLGAVIFSWRSISRTQRLNALILHPRRDEIKCITTGMKACMLGNLAMMFFGSFAYYPGFPIIMSLVISFSEATQFELAAIGLAADSKQRAEPALKPSRGNLVSGRRVAPFETSPARLNAGMARRWAGSGEPRIFGRN